MRRSECRRTRKGQALVEYALLIAGIALVSVVAIALLGRKTTDVIGVMAGIMPGAHAEDNKPLFMNGELMPLDASGDAIKLNAAGLVSPSGLDRMKDMLGAGGGELLMVE